MGQEFSENLFRDSIFDSFKGLDTVSAITNMQPGYLRIARNCNITEVGAIEKRKGIDSVLTSLWGAFSIIAGVEYVVSSTVTRLVVFGSGGTGQLGYINAGAILNISVGLSTNRPSLFQFNSLLFFYNGVACFLYDGTTTRQIGITPPAAAPTFNANIAGGLVVGANYIYAYTYYNSVTGAESSPSPVSAPIACVAGGIRINVAPGVAATADTIRVYRTSANGAILFLDGTAGIAAVTYDSIIADAALSLEMELDNSRITDWGEPRYGTVSQNRVFLTGFSDAPSRVRFSKIGQSGPMPESFQALSFTDCDSLGGLRDPNIGIGQANDVPIIMKQRSIGRLDALGATNDEFAVDNVIFEYKELSRATSCVSHWAQCNVYNNLIWLGTDNIYMTDGKQVIPIADRIADKIRRLVLTQAIKFSGHNDQFNKRIYFDVIYTNEDGIQEEVQIVGSYRNYPEFAWTVYDPGDNTLTHPGIKAGCFFDVTIGSTIEVYAGSSTAVGDVYQMNIGDNDNGSPIFFQVRDYPTSWGKSEQMKLFSKDYIRAKGSTAYPTTYNLDCYSIYDLQEIEEEPFSLQINGDQYLWDLALWDVALWSAEGVRFLEYCSHRMAFYKQLQMQNTNADQPITIYGYVKTAMHEDIK